MRNQTPLIIFSTDRKNVPLATRFKQREKVLEILDKNNVTYTVGVGSYKGAVERCIMVVCYDKIAERVARYLAARYNQESVLYVDADRLARLETPQGDLIERLGHLVNVSRSEATKADAYTMIDGQYWVAVKVSDADNRAVYEHGLIKFADAALAALNATDASNDTALDKIIDAREDLFENPAIDWEWVAENIGTC